VGKKRQHYQAEKQGGGAARGRQYRRHAAKIRSAFQAFDKDGTLPSTAARRPKGSSLIYDEDVQQLCRRAIQALPARWTAAGFRTAVSTQLARKGYTKPGAKISRKSTSFWLAQLGCVRVSEKKGLYKDGHERPDVVEYRERYVTEFKEQFEPHLAVYSGDEMADITEPAGGAKFVEVDHDEVIFSANEGTAQCVCTPASGVWRYLVLTPVRAYCGLANGMHVPHASKVLHRVRKCGWHVPQIQREVNNGVGVCVPLPWVSVGRRGCCHQTEEGPPHTAVAVLR